MSSYLFAALGASTTCPGCLCRDRVRRYPSDLTDAQWKILEPQARQVMDQLRRATGRPMVHDLRAMLDAIGYVTRQGIEWRALPIDFPPWEAVYAFFQRWNERGLPHLLVDRLRARLRTGVGREVQPTAAIMDSQSVKAADTAGANTRGFDNGKKINGRKRHIAVDTEGFLLAAVVTAANIGDRVGAKLLIIALLNTCTQLKLIWADAGYDGKAFATWIHAVARISVRIVKRTQAHTFTVLPRRWVVERTLGWLMRYRRLARDYERRPEHHEAMIYWATIWIMTRRLARRSTDPPHQRRWGRPRPQVSPTPTPA
jgi:transposase